MYGRSQELKMNMETKYSTMNVLKIYICIAMVLTGLAACKKEEVKFYDGPDAAYFKDVPLYTGTTKIPYAQVPLYDFAYQPLDRQQVTLAYPLLISGKRSNKDRTVNLNVVTDSSTAVEGVDYDILPLVVKANTLADSLRIVVKKNSGMKNQIKRLMLEIVPNTDFPETVYRNPQTPSTHILITVADKGGKPANWDGIYLAGTYYKGYGLGQVFGDFSETKFRLVIEVFGTPNILGYYESSPLPKEIWRANIFKLQQILVDYKDKNGHPMLDENGTEIIIPPISIPALLN